ncbi:MAG: NAD(P)-dependent oxidoreductase [Betaproteobacteria bacterium]|nr:NAD(P)-dependent oxidoreductase [Betaproteobacteria bacterium]
MARTIGISGLGIMGSAMAANLARAGFRVLGYDPVPAARRALKRAGGAALRSNGELARRCEVVITSLPSAAALASVAQELAGKAKRDLLVVETSTLPIEAKEGARRVLARAGATLLDCPLSGTGAQARTKDLAVYASGPRAAYRRAVPVLEGFARAHYHVGPFGAGSKMKFLANLLVAIHNVSAAEALVLAMKAGLDPALVVRVVGDGAGSSRMFQVRGPMMVAGDYSEATMKVDVWQKDMAIIADFARALGCPTPLFQASAPFYTAALAAGRGRQDTAAVCAVLEGLAGFERKPARRKAARR